jgi:serine/threonine protein kinase
MTEKEAARILLMFARGIHHIHTFGITHRDVKPANCLLDKKGNLKIIDFGFAVSEKREEHLM